ncbi:inactive protein RESTRICTED TEV MOVEMENT 2-like [Arachis stenosperma]|uniref:inactive protein RESTRICTED TEV MOVEMENT 2-like n=1 Tax=Arachis stenosperma TaxID=217475 RepID=UPI0025AD77C8|nr:inactive protein RESTRICTED TEV MOVEMENT 2-like [Arachis stenosperma]
MGKNNTAGATINGSYEEFEPCCRWIREEKHVTVEIDLKGFKKEQLKVQTNNKGLLTIFGERPLDSSNNKWSRFHKEIRLPKDTNVNEISAKLSHGVLSIVMPKKVEEQYSSSIGELKTRKRTAIKVVIGVVAVVVTLVTLGTFVTRIMNTHYPRGGAAKVDT